MCAVGVVSQVLRFGSIVVEALVVLLGDRDIIDEEAVPASFDRCPNFGRVGRIECLSR